MRWRKPNPNHEKRAVRLGRVAWVLVLLTGCADFVGPDVSVAFVPPSVYEQWHSEAQACSGLTGDFVRITWRMVRGGRWYSDVAGREIGGQWVGPNTIYIAEDLVLDRTVVVHEMLHELIQTPGHGHPQPPFGRCEVG